MRIAFCQLTFERDVERTERCIRRVLGLDCDLPPAVDDVIIVVDETVTEEWKQRFRSYSNVVPVHIVEIEFPDSMPKARNAYLRKARELGVDWICVSDSDELYSETLVRDLRKLIEEAEREGYDMLGVVCREKFEAVEWMDDIDRMKESVEGVKDSNYYKYLIFKLYPDVEYRAAGFGGEVHEDWSRPGGWRVKLLPKEYYYVHEKSAFDIFLNAARNFFIGGGALNVKDLNPYWRPFRELCAKYGLDTWHKFRRALLRDELPEEIVQKLIEFLDLAGPDYYNEMRQTAKAYFVANPHRITPEIEKKLKNPPKITDEDALIEYEIRKAYIQVLGRDADLEGLQHYKKLIKEGKIRVEDLPQILMNSEEYAQKFGERIDVTKDMLPHINITLNLTDEALMKIIERRSKKFEIVRRRLDLAEFIEKQLDDVEGFYKEFYKLKEGVTIGTIENLIWRFKKGTRWLD